MDGLGVDGGRDSSNPVIPAKRSAERESRPEHHPCLWIPADALRARWNDAEGLGFGDDGSWDSPCARIVCAPLIPGTWRVWQHMRAACRRRGVMHPTPHMASGRRLEGRSSLEGRDPGGPDGPLAAKRQQCRGNAGRLQWLKVRSRSSGRPGAAQEAKATGRDTNRRNAGAGRQPWHREVRSTPTRDARGGPRGSPGTGASQPRGCRVRHPRYPSHLRPHRRGRTARGRSE